MDKPNCYKCKHRGNVPGDAHSCCRHPDTVNAVERLGITANKHGVINGWFMWPANFDPAWLVSCDGFEKKAEAVST